MLLNLFHTVGANWPFLSQELKTRSPRECAIRHDLITLRNTLFCKLVNNVIILSNAYIFCKSNRVQQLLPM